MNFHQTPYDKFLTSVFIFFVAIFGSSQSQAYFSTLDTGEIVGTGEYRASIETQGAFGDNSGFNFAGRFDAGVDDASNVRIILGTGATSFDWGMYYKWVPIPDYKNQPALGLLSGFDYARIGDKNYLSIKAHPLISKKFVVDRTEWTPYGSIPIGFTFSSGETKVPVQLALGTEFKPGSLKYISFLGEVGFNLLNSFGYISLAAQIRFDESGGVTFK